MVGMDCSSIRQRRDQYYYLLDQNLAHKIGRFRRVGDGGEGDQELTCGAVVSDGVRHARWKDELFHLMPLDWEVLRLSLVTHPDQGWTAYHTDLCSLRVVMVSSHTAGCCDCHMAIPLVQQAIGIYWLKDEASRVAKPIQKLHAELIAYGSHRSGCDPLANLHGNITACTHQGFTDENGTRSRCSNPIHVALGMNSTFCH